MRFTRAKRRRRRREGITLNLASMIDVTFLLLLYFMVTTVLARPEDRLSPTLQTESESNVGAAADFQPQIVEVRRIDGAPAYRLGSQVVRDAQELTAALRNLHKPSGLFVRVFDDVEVGFAAAALQAGRDAGFEQVTYVPAEDK